MRNGDTAWGEKYWSCNCPLCRGLVKPLFRGLLSHKKPSFGGEEKEGKEVEKMSSEEEGKKKDDIEELKGLVEALKDSILELKATISDISSPFNKMKQAAETGEEETEEQAVTPLSASPRIVYPEKTPSPPMVHERTVGTRERREEAELKETVPEPETGKEEEKMALEKKIKTIEEIKEKRPSFRPPTDLKKALKMMRMMYKLSEKVPGEHIKQYLRLLKTLGLLDEKTSETIEVLTKIVEEGAEKGMSPEDQMIAIYSLAKMLGVEDPDLEEEMTLLMIEKLRQKGGSASWESLQQ